MSSGLPERSLLQAILSRGFGAVTELVLWIRSHISRRPILTLITLTVLAGFILFVVFLVSLRLTTLGQPHSTSPTTQPSGQSSTQLTPSSSPPATNGAKAPVPAPLTAFGDGTFVVGTDIKPGTYKNTGAGDCYWERLRGFGNTLNDKISNDLPGTSQSIVTISPTDKGFSSENCGTWHLISTPATTSSVEEGAENSVPHWIIRADWRVARMSIPPNGRHCLLTDSHWNPGGERVQPQSITFSVSHSASGPQWLMNFEDDSQSVSSISSLSVDINSTNIMGSHSVVRSAFPNAGVFVFELPSDSDNVAFLLKAFATGTVMHLKADEFSADISLPVGGAGDKLVRELFSCMAPL
jgi:hypothetical protein